MGSEGSDIESERPDLGTERPVLRLKGMATQKPKKIALCGIISNQPLLVPHPRRKRRRKLVIQGSDMVSSTQCPAGGDQLNMFRYQTNGCREI